MDIKLAKQVLTEALDRAFKAGLFNLIEAKNVTDALVEIANMPEFESQGLPQPISLEDLKKFNPEQKDKA